MHGNVGLGVMSPTEDNKRKAMSHATAEDLQDYSERMWETACVISLISL